MLDWYTIVVGVAALLALTQHGALWVILKTDGEMRDRSRAIFRALWWAVGAVTTAITVLSFQVQPHLLDRFQQAPAGFIFPVLAVAGLIVTRVSVARFTNETAAFLGSCAYLLGMLLSVAWGLYPFVLPSNLELHGGLTVRNSAAASYGLQVGLVWWIPGMLLVTEYFVFTTASSLARSSEWFLNSIWCSWNTARPASFNGKRQVRFVFSYCSYCSLLKKRELTL